MSKIPIYTVDAFTDTLFRGNTCAVCIFEEWPHDGLLQSIAIQNQFAETAFLVLRPNASPELRWFTVSQEVDFCGYGTLSAGYVYLRHLAPSQTQVTFTTRYYGDVPVKKIDDIFQIEVGAKHPTIETFNDAVFAALGGTKPATMIESERRDLLIVYADESEVRGISPNFEALMRTGYYGYVLTSVGDRADYAYRYFSPRMTNVWEDPVNGASQSVLAPYWAQKLERPILHGQAASKRGGDVYCEYHNNGRVLIGGRVSPYLTGELTL